MKKGSKNHRETLYSSKGKIVYDVKKPFNIYRLQGKPYDNYRISLQSVNIAEKTYGNPVNPCKHLQCSIMFGHIFNVWITVKQYILAHFF